MKSNGLFGEGLRLLKRLIAATAIAIACATLGCSNKNQENAATPQQGNGGGRGQVQGAGGGPRGPAVVPVGVTAAQQQDVPIYLSGLGTVTAYNTVTVRSRVDGAIVKINFTEGQHVRTGQVLAEIDPRPYQVQLETAQGNLARDKALLNTSQVNLQRNQALAQAGVISQQQLDQQRAETGQYTGTLQADQAAISSARLNLTYSRVTAPISGRVGLRQIDIGNIVHASDQNGICTITQLQPIAIIFTLPEDSAQRVRGRMRQGTLATEAYSRDDLTKIAQGKLETIDNQIDPTTGTVKLKAVFPNQDEQLWPNEFVNVHLRLETQKNAIVVPSSAIQRGPQGTFVYVVGQDNTVQVHNVQVSLTQGLNSLIASGVNAGDRVVTDGQERLQANMKVDPRAPQQQRGNGQSAGNQGIGSGPGA